MEKEYYEIKKILEEIYNQNGYRTTTRGKGEDELKKKGICIYKNDTRVATVYVRKDFYSVSTYDSGVVDKSDLEYEEMARGRMRHKFATVDEVLSELKRII